MFKNSAIINNKSNYLHRLAVILFFAALFIDYGGGFYLKASFSAIILLYSILSNKINKHFVHVYNDVLVLIIVPVIFNIVHCVNDDMATLDYKMSTIYNRGSSMLFILLTPIFLLCGSQNISRYLTKSLAIAGFATILVTTLHFSGLINIREYEEVATTYKIGLFGTDLRSVSKDERLNILPSLSSCQALPVGFCLAVTSSSWISAALTFIGLLFTTQRGLWLGIALFLIFLTLLMKRKILKSYRFYQIFLTLMFSFLIVLGLYRNVESIREVADNSYFSVLDRFNSLTGGYDDSTDVRIGHIEGYWMMAKEAFPNFVFGLPQTRGIYNKITDDYHDKTEIVILNYMIWYGIPYALIFAIWLIYRLNQLYRCIIKSTNMTQLQDYGLLCGTASFWIIGNINPMLATPVAFILFSLVRVRVLELSGIMFQDEQNKKTNNN